MRTSTRFLLILFASGCAGKVVDPAVQIRLGGFSDDTAVDENRTNGCVVRASGHSSCWGPAAVDPSTEEDANVIEVVAPPSLQAPNDTGCLLLSTGALKCWGDNSVDQLTDSVPAGSALSRPQIVADANGLTQIAIGDSFVCGLSSAGAVECWGGLPWAAQAKAPVAVPGFSKALSLAAFADTACIVDDTSHVACISAQGLQPVRFVEPHDAVQVAVLGTSGQFSYDGTLQWCAVRISGAVVCWAGTDNAGSGVLFTVPNLSDATKVAVGQGQSCVLESSGDVTCWPTILEYGSPDIGDYTSIHFPPQRVSGLPPLVDVSVGTDDACGVDSGGNITCWTGPESTYRLIEVE